MPNFKYRAVNADGQILESTLVAPDKDEVVRQLRKLNMVPVEVNRSVSKNVKKSGNRKIKIKTLLLFVKQLHTLLKAGIPIITGLNAIREQATDDSFKQLIESIIKDVEQGTRFSDALAQFPRVFPEIFINSIRVGEVSGTLEETLLYLYSYLEEEDRIKKDMKKALRYPLFVTVGLISAFLVFTTVVIPNFIPIFKMSSTQLPLPTRLLMGAYYLISNYGFILLFLLVCAITGLVLYIRTPKGKFQFDGFLLKLPVLGEVIRKVSISRFAKIFYTMNRTGIPVVQTFEILQDAMDNSVFAREIKIILEKIKRGEGIANSMKQSPFFTTFVVEMLAIGEQSGSLDEMLANVSEYYSQEVSETVGNMTALIEPIVTVALGGMVLFLALALFLPMWDLMSIVK